MEFFSSIIWLIIILAAFVASRLWDAYVSSDYEMFGLTEANPLFRDKFQTFVAWKHHVGTAVVVAAVTIIYPFWHDIWVLPAILAAGHFIWVAFNKQKKGKMRESQIAFLRRIKGALDNQQMPLIPCGYYRGRWFVKGFNFIHVGDSLSLENPDQMNAVKSLTERMYELARNPESQWFAVQ